MRLAAIALLVLSFTIAGSRGLLAQQQNLTVKVDGFKADDWSKARVIVTVLNGDGKPALGLTTPDFLTEINGTTVPATGLARGVDSDLPASVVLALDVSGGLPSGALDQAKAAANKFIDGLGPNDSVAVLAFSDAANLVQPFTQDRAVAHAAVDRLSAGGGDALYQAATQSILLAAASADTGRRAVVLLSAAGGNGSDEVHQQSLTAAKGLGVPVFAIGLGAGVDRQYLRELSDGGGGQLTEAATPEGLIQLYQDLSELLRDQYVLTFDASVLGLRSSDAATLRVTATSNGSSGSGERLVCPQLCVRLSDVAVGDQIGKARTVTAEVISAVPVASVTFYVDDKKAATVTQSPYQFTLDPTKFSGGEHTLAAEVASASTSTRGADVRVRFGGGGSGGSSGGSFIVIGAVVVLAVMALFIVVYFLRRRHGGAEGPRPVSPGGKPKGRSMAKPRIRLRLLEEGEGPPAPVADAGALLGRLHVVSGPLAAQTFAMGSAPLTIGSGQRCLIRLPHALEEGGEVAPEFARIWIRGSRLMVHELRRLTATGPVGGRWEMLADGDVFSIGPCSFRFELGEAKSNEAPEPVPMILRSSSRLAVEGSVPAEPIVDILKRRPSDENGPQAEESTQEDPPQAAAAP